MDDTRATRYQLERLIRGLTEYPDLVEVSASRRGRDVQLRVRVDDDDLGAVIGRRGRTASALRFLLDKRGRQSGQRYDMRILED